MARHYTRLRSNDPLVLQLVNEVFDCSHRFYCFDAIDDLRRIYLQDRSPLKASDFSNDGSEVRTTTVARVAGQSAIGSKHGELLSRLVNFSKPDTILELGTSLGISTLYLSMSRQSARVYTLDGNGDHQRVATKSFKNLQLHNITPFCGLFECELPKVLNQIERVDFVFIDGHHQYEPTLTYFEQCLARSTDDTVFAFHDIHWSEGMVRAWQQICQHPRVSLTIDLFHLGLVFLHKTENRQHYVVRF